MATKALNLVRCPAQVCLDRHDLENLILQGRSKEQVNDLMLLDGKREEVDLLQRLDLAILHQAAKFGHGDPFLLLLAPAASPATIATAPASSTRGRDEPHPNAAALSSHL